MDKTTLTAKLAIAASDVASLEKKRGALRADAAADPRTAKLESLRVHRVTYKLRLKRTDLTDEETGNLQSALSENEATAEALLTEVHAPLVELQEKLSVARKELRKLRQIEAVEALAGSTEEQLTQRRSQLSTERRKLKRELQTVVAALSKLEAKRAVAELVASKNDAERKELFDKLSEEFAPAKS